MRIPARIFIMLQLLRTKTILPPARPKRVQLHRLLYRIGEGTLRALTLVVAPAGFGKTTLVLDWAHSARLPVAWLSLDSGDQSPERFLAYLIQSFQSIDKQIGQSALTLLHGVQKMPLEAAIATLLNNLSEITTDITVILDDYHTCDSPEIAHIVDFLLEHRPPGLNMILISRTTPALHLPRLRAADQIIEVTSSDLRFTDDEIQTFLEDILGARPSPNQFSSLSELTEGWAVGLQLAGMALARYPEQWSLPA